MIPVFITVVLNRYDLLERLLASIDVPVGRGLVVDNGRSGWTREFNDGDWRVWSPPFNGLGWPGALNFGITQTPDAPWWCFANNDAWFEPGSLERMAQRMEAADGPLVVTEGFTVGAINREAVDVVGLFDEWSFFPIYFDDNDYTYRCRLAGVSLERDSWCREGDLDGKPSHSLTTKSDPELDRANNRTWQLNRQAYVAKWGGPPGRERFTTPWGRDVPIWATKPDVDGRTARTW